MSYSFSVPIGPAEDLRERAERAAEGCKASLAANWVDEADDDIAAAIDAAVRLAQSLAGGDGLVHVGATISGHANAGRTVPQGWSNDSVYVSVARAVPTPAAEASP
jgi:hypothetical protein